MNSEQVSSYYSKSKMTKAAIKEISSISETVYNNKVKKLEQDIDILKRNQAILEMHNIQLENALNKILKVINI